MRVVCPTHTHVVVFTHTHVVFFTHARTFFIITQEYEKDLCKDSLKITQDQAKGEDYPKIVKVTKDLVNFYQSVNQILRIKK